ncbi:MAG: response regulator [Anaerolineales bacterium]
MDPENTGISLDILIEWVHEAFGHLYDTHELQETPLTRYLAGQIPDPLLRSQEVRRMLLESIHSIRPEPGVPSQSSDWRSYRIMELRYIKGLSPTEAMDQLAVGKSQFFREQARALKQVAQVLWEQTRPDSESASESTSRATLAHSEADRLLQSANWEPVDLDRLIEELLPLVEPLAKVKQVTLRFLDIGGIRLPRADRVILRQAVLNIITFAMDFAAGEELNIRGFQSTHSRGITISAQRTGSEASPRTGVGLEVVRRLIGEMGGEMNVEDQQPREWTARLSWHTTQPRILLVVDDNQGFADLFRRYLAVHRWEVIGAADGEAAFAEIGRKRPTVIILDVMMPRQDGWEVLMRLKSREESRNIPVIVCSVLSEPQLAASLGAQAYLTKPVTQQALLQALTPWKAEESVPAPARAESPLRSEAPPT